MNGALAGGTLGAKLREQIALATAQVNDCDYCLSAHSLIGKGAGLGGSDIAKARSGEADDGRAGAVLRFVGTLLVSRGQATEHEVAAMRAAGPSTTVPSAKSSPTWRSTCSPTTSTT
jgi:AhpD family alkylhydroperoxidase